MNKINFQYNQKLRLTSGTFIDRVIDDKVDGGFFSKRKSSLAKQRRLNMNIQIDRKDIGSPSNTNEGFSYSKFALVEPHSSTTQKMKSDSLGLPLLGKAADSNFLLPQKAHFNFKQ